MSGNELSEVQPGALSIDEFGGARFALSLQMAEALSHASILPDHLRELAEACRAPYETLYSQRIRV